MGHVLGGAGAEPGQAVYKRWRAGASTGQGGDGMSEAYTQTLCGLLREGAILSREIDADLFGVLASDEQPCPACGGEWERDDPPRNGKVIYRLKHKDACNVRAATTWRHRVATLLEVAEQEGVAEGLEALRRYEEDMA